MTRFRKSDYDIAALVRTMLGVAAVLLRTRLPQAREVAGRVCARARCGPRRPDRVPLLDLVDPLAKMGQVLFTPPNVKGWRTGTDWLNSATLLARNNFAETVAMGEWTEAGVGTGRARQSLPDVRRRADEPSAPTSSSTPPPPAAGRTRCAARSTRRSRRTSPAIVKRMGELRLRPRQSRQEQAAKLEKFLNAAGPPPGAAAATAARRDHAPAPGRSRPVNDPSSDRR